MRIPPIKNPVTYRWHTAKWVKGDPSNKDDHDRWIGGQLANIPDMDVITTNEGQIRLHYYERSSTKVINGVRQEQPIYYEPRMDGTGHLEVTPDQPDLYYYLELCNFNGHNKNRRSDVPVLFYRVDKIDSEGGKITTAKRRADAVNWIWNKATMMDLVTAAEALQIDTVRRGDGGQKDEDSLRYEIEGRLGDVDSLRDMKISYDSFLRMVDGAKLKVMAHIYKAVKKGVIQFEGPTRRWAWCFGPNHSPSETIVVVPPTYPNSRLYLVDHLLLPAHADSYSQLLAHIGEHKPMDAPKDELETMVKLAYDTGVLEENRFRIRWKGADEKLFGITHNEKDQLFEKTVEFFRENADLQEILQDKVGK